MDGVSEVHTDLLRVDIERGHESQLTDVIVAELDMHQPRHPFRRRGAAVVLDALDQRRSTVAHAHQCHTDGTHARDTIATHAHRNATHPEVDRTWPTLIRNQGLLVIKDFTSIISANSRLRGDILSALREIYDGHWYRDVGGEGGRRLTWKGRLTVIGACTTAWDRAHEVVTTMGDRFVVIRADSSNEDARRQASHQAIDNTRAEEAMRAELAEAAGAVLNGMRDKIAPLTKREMGVITDAADLVTRARTAVEYDYSGNVIDSHALEMPTRFSRQLAQVVFGAQAIGLSRREAIKLAIRCARDSVPPMRLAIIRDLEQNQDEHGTSAGGVRKRLDKPHMTVKRQLESLHQLGVCTMREQGEYSKTSRKTVGRYYTLADYVNPAALTSPEKLLQGASGAKSSAKGQKESAAAEQETAQTESPGVPSNKSGGVLPLICEICLQPMPFEQDGQTTHPNCDDQDRITRGPYFVLADLDEYRRRRLLTAAANPEWARS